MFWNAFIVSSGPLPGQAYPRVGVVV